MHELPTSSSPQPPAYPHNIPYSPGPVTGHRNSSTCISPISTTPYETVSELICQVFFAVLYSSLYSRHAVISKYNIINKVLFPPLFSVTSFSSIHFLYYHNNVDIVAHSSHFLLFKFVLGWKWVKFLLLQILLKNVTQSNTKHWKTKFNRNTERSLNLF